MSQTDNPGGTMTPKQRRLARHALGLPNPRSRSYRNRFAATYALGNYDEWVKMTEAGLAGQDRVMSGDPRFIARFWLTEAGAQAALDPGETLCPEDFPDQEEP